MILRNIDFKGPFRLDEEIPAEPGIYMVCTDSAGGFRFLGVYESDNMKNSYENNPWKNEWIKYDDHGLILFYSVSDGTASQRESAVRGIIDTRCYEVPCVAKIQDDW